MSQKFDTCGGDSQRASENKSSDRVGCNDNRNKRQKGIVDKGPAVDGDLVETKKEGNQSSQDCMKTEERREGNENSN